MKILLALISLHCCVALAIEPLTLTLPEARQTALAHHPKITSAELRVLAAHEVAVEARAAFFPSITANATAVGTSQDNTRIAAGSLSNPGIFERNAEGVNVSQLITDFGRTANLSRSAKLREKAEAENRDVTRAQLLLLVDTTYFDALRAQSVLNVATQTVSTREILLNQVSALASNQLKSELDVSFARVTLDEGKLLALKADNDLQASFARLSTLLGSTQQQSFQLEDAVVPTNGIPDVAELTAQALASRPDLLQLRLEHDAAQKFAKAERALNYPVISAVGSAGVIPLHDSHFEDNYAAGGINLSLPLFAGGLYSARQREAALRAQVVEEQLRDRENEVLRDVRIAWLGLNSARERLGVTERMLEHAARAYDLAKARYDAGSASMVELSQAQLNKTAAQIATASARFDYKTQLSVMAYQSGAPLPTR
jgi:outer membrane protein